ncbi:hypothetical protein SM007_05475 [Streptomyces avermitilis]|uniref:Uncharacterized protein n=1 Tax=Streptomyces avermitilis TaxID=33903 RepID=A0A4D4LQJ9_STRAX|nr:hypothetical protein SM007_05475 [Streptomyces avermitilis]BBJ51779.1 hypothetical protein SAVMC3_44080 [Streptomyces avermitilis]GDY63821.1 hypothetical protein SAV14893_032140 [Streptomyces avermitilis]GDY76035.1 hypothetical protein SAV31267_055200 [Streptomyces avermitilis]
MRHTVRRLPRGVEQAVTGDRPAPRAAHIAGSGTVTGAAPGWLGLRTTRIPHKVPEHDADSRP